MNSKEYVLNHNFGYGTGKLDATLNKLELRNIQDVNFYINWSIKELFVANVTEDNIITFFEDNSKAQILIEKIEV